MEKRSLLHAGLRCKVVYVALAVNGYQRVVDSKFLSLHNTYIATHFRSSNMHTELNTLEALKYKIVVDEYGDKYYYNSLNQRHRENGPAIERANGSKEWYINNQFHREDGPAIERADGTKAWYIDGKLHREDGPAIEYANGTKAWFINDQLHREDGPKA